MAGNWLVIEKNVGALDVSVKKVFLVTVVESIQQLLHERRDTIVVERHKTTLQQTHQVVVHVLEHQVKRTCKILTYINVYIAYIYMYDRFLYEYAP